MLQSIKTRSWFHCSSGSGRQTPEIDGASSDDAIAASPTRALRTALRGILVPLLVLGRRIDVEVRLLRHLMPSLAILG